MTDAHEGQPFHLRYRPADLSQIIGHSVAVTRLQGMVASGKVPNALLFTGPTSVGKTTLARALAADLNGKPADKQQDYMEINGTDQRSIDDIRNLIQVSKFKSSGKKRIIVIDEAQGVLSNAPAAAALLKPLEEPSPDTLWILCSMDPTKFSSGNGKAIATRCTQFVLEPHSNGELLKQAMRIAKAERMTFVDKDLLKKVVLASGSAMRTLANLLQGLRDYHAGLGDEAPDMLEASAVSDVLSSSESADEKLVAPVMAAIFGGQYAAAQKCLLYVADGFQFMSKLLWAASFMVNMTVLNGQRHPKVWFTPQNKEMLALMKTNKIAPTLGQMAAVQAAFVEMKAKAQSFAVGELELMSATIYRVIKEIHAK